MKINQIISENENLTEEPVGRLKRAGHKIGSKLGSRGSQAKLDVANDANEIKKNLKAWMDGSGIGEGQLSVDKFKRFLDQVGLPTDKIDNLFSDIRKNPDGTYKAGGMSNKEIDDILLKAVQQGFEMTGAAKQRSRFAVPKSRASSTNTERDAINLLRSKGYKVTK